VRLGVRVAFYFIAAQQTSTADKMKASHQESENSMKRQLSQVNKADSLS
jgi:hypothetical protein